MIRFGLSWVTLGLTLGVLGLCQHAKAETKAPEICAILNQVLDLEEEFFLSPNANYESIEQEAYKISKELAFYEPYRTECKPKQLQEARRTIDFVLGRVSMRRYDDTRKKYYLSDAIQYFEKASRGGRFGETTFLLGLAKVRYGWLMPANKRAWKYEYDGLKTMLDAIAGRFSEKALSLLDRVDEPFKFNGRIVGSTQVESARQQLGPAWKKIRQAYRQVAVTKASLGSLATNCTRERTELDGITKQLRAAGRRGMTRKLMQEVQKLQGKIASYRSRCSEVEAIMGDSASSEAQGDVFIQLMGSIREFEEPLEFLYWSTRLFQSLVVTATRHHDAGAKGNFRRIDQIIPIARVLADQLAMVENKNPSIFRSLREDEDMVLRGMGKTYSCGEKRSLETNVRLCHQAGNSARGILLASYYNNQNFLAGAFRYIGLTLRTRWETQLLAAGNEPLRESVFEAVRSALGLALKFIGQADVKSLNAYSEDGLKIERTPEELLQYNALSEAELHLNIAELEIKYSLTFSILTRVDKKETIKKVDRPGDLQRYAGIANSAFGHLRSAVDKVSRVKTGLLDAKEDGVCLETQDDTEKQLIEQLVTRVRFRYGAALENAMRKSFESGDYSSILSMSDAVRVPFDFIERADAYSYLAEAALMDEATSANIAAQFAATGIAAFVEQADKPLHVWRGLDTLDPKTQKPCQVFSLDMRKTLVKEQISTGFGEMVRPRCKVLSKLLGILKANSSAATYEKNKDRLLQIDGLDWSQKPWGEDVQCEGQDDYRCKQAREICGKLYEEYLQ